MQDKKQAPKPKNKQNRQKHQKANKTNQTQKQKPARLVVSRSVHGQLEDARKDDNIVSPQGLVWQCKTKAKQQTTKCHTTICEPGSNKCTMRKPRLPPARSPEITECSRTGNMLTDSWIRSKSQQDAVLSHLIRRR